MCPVRNVTYVPGRSPNFRKYNELHFSSCDSQRHWITLDNNSASLITLPRKSKQPAFA
jgi:hypothetical protein